jgi:hypothetical protein
MIEFCMPTEENTLDGLGCEAEVNVCVLPVPIMLLPDQLRVVMVLLGSIQYTPGLEAAAAMAASASRGRQWISRTVACRLVAQGRWVRAASACRQPADETEGISGCGMQRLRRRGVYCLMHSTVRRCGRGGWKLPCRGSSQLLVLTTASCGAFREIFWSWMSGGIRR